MSGMIYLSLLRQSVFDNVMTMVYNIPMMKKKILKTIEEHHLIENGAHIVIGLSGGPDSVCLFDVLCQAAKERNWTIYPVHINHQLRPGAAEADQAYVEHLSASKGMACRTFVYDCIQIAKTEKLTSEEAGRNVRYESFAKVAEELKAQGIPAGKIIIAVAQNADDQAETILFRILRGAGIDGLAGIGYSRFDAYGNRIVRPLLDCSKTDILAYCESQNLQPCIDQTNMESVYTRNKIRLQLIPYLEKEYNPNIKDTMIRMGKTCASDRDFLWQTARKAFEMCRKRENEDEVIFDGTALKSLHRSIRQRVLSMAFGQLGLTEDITYTHFDQCEDIVFHQHPSARTDLPRGYYLTKHYDDIKAARGGGVGGEKRLHIRRLSMEEYHQLGLAENEHAVFDADAMEAFYGKDFAERIRLQTREAGDTIAIAAGKRKKLQDYFVDRKIPKDERDRIPVVKIVHDVLWVPPYQGKGRFCSNFKLCSDTKNVICVEIICVLC